MRFGSDMQENSFGDLVIQLNIAQDLVQTLMVLRQSILMTLVIPSLYIHGHKPKYLLAC